MIQKTSQRQLNALTTGRSKPTSSARPDGRTVIHNADGPEDWGYWIRDRHYSLEVAQHPIRARMCGFGDKDRRPLAPAAVVKMTVRRRDNSVVEVDDIDYDFFVVTVDLWSTDGKEEMNLVLHPSASDRYLPSHLAKPRKRQVNELAGIPGGPNNATTLTARSSTRPSPYPSAVERIRPFSNQSPKGHNGGGEDDPNSLTPLLTSPTIPSSTQPSPLPYPYPTPDSWSTSTQPEQGQWPYSPIQSQGQTPLTLPSIHSLDSTTFGANNHDSPSTASPPSIPFHVSLGMISSLADLQSQFQQPRITPGTNSTSVTLTDINDNNNVSPGGGFGSWTGGLFDSMPDTQTAATHDSFSHLSSMDPWSPTSPTLDPSLSQATSFQAYIQQNSFSLSSQAIPVTPSTPTMMPPPPQLVPRQEKERADRIPSNVSARERELSAAIANAIPRHTYTRTLVGPLSANAQRLQDEHRKPGIFFLFQDLSIRTEGTFRLRMRLMNVGMLPAPNECSNSVHTGASPVLAQVFTEPFTVYSAKRFPGVPDTTALSIAFGNQGQKLPLRNRHANNKLSRRLGRPDCASSDEEFL